MRGVLVAGLVYVEVHLPQGVGLERAEIGRERFVPSLPIRLGGAINVASGLRALETPVRLAAPVPDSLVGSLLEQTAERLQLPLLRWPATTEGCVSVVFHDGGDRGFLSSEDLAALEQVSELPRSEWVHVPGLAEARSLWSPLALARRRGARLSLNLSWDPAGFERLRGDTALALDLVVMNELEATALAGGPDEALRLLTPRSLAAVVTLGSDGAVGLFGGQRLQVPASASRVVDPTGAGDAFCAGVLAALQRELGPEVAMSWGHRAAAHVLGLYGGVVEGRLRFETEPAS